MEWVKRFMRNDSGFTVVEYVIAAAILFIVSTGVMGALAYAGTANASTNMREVGLEVANQRMEQARNLVYDDLGTTDNYPAGDIVSPETVTVATGQGSRSFVVVTKVDYVIDYTNDTVYGEEASKNIRITVSWTNPRAGSVIVESNIIGKSALLNAGTVIINVVDSDTNAKVLGATITIKPSSGAAASKTTGVDGFVRWGKVPSGSMTITGTCTTHYLDLTPLAGGATVLANKKPPNEWTIQAIRSASGTVHVTDQNGSNLAGVAVTISNPSLPAYSDWSCPTGTGTAISDANGNAVFPKLRKGTYAVTGVLSGYAQQATPAASLSVVAGGGSYTSQLPMKKLTTIKVTVTDNSNVAIQGVTVSATGVTFASTTDVTGQATSNDMGAIGTNRTYTVTAQKTGYTSNTGSVTLSQYTQGTVTIQLAPPPPTTIKVTVTNNSGVPIQGATVTATGVTFASTTDVNGQATSNDMGAIGTNQPYTVTARKTGWANNTGSVTLSQYTQGTVTIKLRATLEVLYSGTYPRVIYVYTGTTPGGAPAYTATASSSTSPASFNLVAGTYYVSRRATYGASGATPVTAVVANGTTLAITIGGSD